MSFFTYLDLPHIPDELIKEILRICDDPSNNFHNSDEFLEYAKSNRDTFKISAGEEVIEAISNLEIDYDKSLGYPLSDAHIHFQDLAQFDFLEVTDEINRWVAKNISESVAYVSIQSMYGGTTITPHIDEMRKFAYNYVIDTGGDSKTLFWTPKPEYKHLMIYPQTIFPYDRIDVLDEISIDLYRWHRLDTSTIHSVENLNPTKKRISLSLSFL